jgi:hypothetical protein
LYLINTNLNFLLLSFIASCAALKNVSAKQIFRALPKNLQVLEGSEALLQCEITNLAGSVQWVKDGFALGKIISIFDCSWQFNQKKLYTLQDSQRKSRAIQDIQ